MYEINHSINRRYCPMADLVTFLSDLNHKAILTQVRDDNDEYVDYLNIYEKVNGEELGSQPYKLVEHYSGKKTNPEILVVNQDAKGPLELEGNSMMKVLYTTQEFTEGVPEDWYFDLL